MTLSAVIERQHFSSVGSTNDLALDAFRDGRIDPLWITADEQLDGKGRRGRNWVSPPGNFYGSLLLVDPAPSEALPQLAFVISLALHKALSRALPPDVQRQLTVKWPNDLLYDRKKIAGILMEATHLAGRTGIVIGCGINCTTSPVKAPYPVTNFIAEGQVISAEAVFDLFSAQVATVLSDWQAGHNFSSIREAWLQRASGVGEDITVRLNDRELEGRFTGLDAKGRLLLSHPENGTSVISAGDVFMLPLSDQAPEGH
ncbi:biotin--[acetyl-CoA-carboxylase] ligase [Pararhizobium sp. IMCC21322]|uniref:biotin--[acetyl-CoA-carboxylase] ligase n=1 Tax=Pararhizobium sp. IMCC21322 TaxID=3067903 RepID=UPI002742011B|nr:biotin--[acetyl-CoA-carboxylase] ligase [Pararhizobium sp. IMCC21322]